MTKVIIIGVNHNNSTTIAEAINRSEKHDISYHHIAQQMSKENEITKQEPLLITNLYDEDYKPHYPHQHNSKYHKL